MKKSYLNKSPIIDYWNFYSAVIPNFCGGGGEVVYYNHSSFCEELFMEFKSDGTVRSYYDFDCPGNPGCSNEITTGTWKKMDNDYYISDGFDDVKINLLDDNTISYEYDGSVYTYKKTINE